MAKFDLNPQQKSAAEAPRLPLLIVAGAGTGKTQTLTGRLAHLIKSGADPEKICAITFTNKAANEMRERVANSKERVANSHTVHLPFIGTFHSLGARILRTEAKLVGRNRNFAIFDDEDSLKLIKRIHKSLADDKERVAGGEKIGPAFFARRISQIKNGALSASEIKKSSDRNDKLAAEIFERYEKSLKENNAFDFDDLIEKVVSIFQLHPAALKKYRQRFHYVLVDEYQDLNNKQYELIKLLAGESKNLTVVGDDQQMIYGWRDANLKIFLNFENDWPGAQVALLEQNYRSTKNIIAAASAVIQNNRYQRAKNLWTENKDGEKIKIVETGNEDEEAEWISEEIANSKEQIANSIAVLYRTNAQSRALEQALIEKNIPYKIFGGIRFYERKEMKDILAALRFASNPADQISAERLEKNLSKTKFLSFGESLAGKKDFRPLELINTFLKAADYLNYVEKNFLNAAERLENISELCGFASGFGDLPSFLEKVALVQQTDDLANSKAQIANSGHLPFAVNLMTIHLAKGLEFDRVFVAGCGEGILPHNRSLQNGEELEEERRLMYVAMTRAKKELCLSFYDLPSRFLGELPDELAEFDGQLSSEENYITLD